MKLDFTGRHFTVTPAIKKFAREQAKKIEKIFDGRDGVSAHFTLAVEKRRHIAEISLSFKDQQLNSEATTDDMYAAITQAVDKMERQATKRKTKATSKSRKEREVVRDVTPAEPETPPAKSRTKASPAVKSAESKKPRIVQTRKYAVKPMTPDDAALNLAADDQFIVFRNVDSDRIGVLYRRKDGNLGLIEP